MLARHQDLLRALAIRPGIAAGKRCVEAAKFGQQLIRTRFGVALKDARGLWRGLDSESVQIEFLFVGEWHSFLRVVRFRGQWVGCFDLAAPCVRIATSARTTSAMVPPIVAWWAFFTSSRRLG